ncbi:hypothetical protein BUALT_Bualt16G0078100 [Buddleja alternifolia]|uniref:Retroviral polymerase SH3-like domain-containing protein n=1 Tax=Buddleja alternifolia TaxID=168488 RepID=A0AAV6WGH6_9LAMI|nr:hypothetical protein BUALT_Bualt16G0078100 [Buddleja alternifolia]
MQVLTLLYGRESLRLDEVQFALNSRELNNRNDDKSQSHAEGLNVRGWTEKREFKKKDSHSRSKSRTKRRCYHCHKKGRIRRFSPERQQKKNGDRKEKPGVAISEDGYGSAFQFLMKVQKRNDPRLWSGHPPDLNRLKVFGCIAYAHFKQDKLEPRALKCIFLGYPEGSKAYKPWCLEHDVRKCIISRDAVFNENLMGNLIISRIC